MAKKVDDSVLDAALNEIKNNCTRMVVCSAEPANYTAANTGGANNLGDVTMFQLVFANDRWWILSTLWQRESNEFPIPANLRD
jgi:hypothetical protein